MDSTKAASTGSLLLFVMLLAAGPAFAQTDLSGTWSNLIHEDGTQYRISGPAPGDYTGHPINEAGRMHADAWSESRNTVPEFQCIPHGAAYWQNAGSARILPVVHDVTQNVVALHMDLHFYRVTRDIWLDGRPHPPEEARHTWSGFSTGQWDGNRLTITTTHLKENRVTRSGIEHSDQAVLTEHIFRHGNRLTWITVIDDPIYFEEPMIHSRTYFLDLERQLPPYPCVAAVEVDRPIDLMPHWLPGQNPSLHEWAERYGIPLEAARGGAKTLLPEYREELK